MYRKHATAGISLTRSFSLTRQTIVKPEIRYAEQWQDRLSALDPHDRFNGTYNTSVNLRQRLTRRIDLDALQVYRVRTEPNSIATDSNADDKGIEQNHLGLSTYISLLRSSYLTIGSGYDFHKNKNEIVPTYKQKIDNVSAGLNVAFGKTSFYLSDSYDVYPRMNTSFGGDVRIGTLFATTVGYNKSQKGILNVYNTVKCNLTPKTNIDVGVRYIASGPGRMNYDRVLFTERNVMVTRDLHCFEFKITYTYRGVNNEEIMFNIQLKADMQRQKRLMNKMHEQEFYPWRT
jgi:hypothetical protein